MKSARPAMQPNPEDAPRPGREVGGLETGVKADSLIPQQAHKYKLNRRKAIRERCLNCTSWIPSEVSECPMEDCSLHPFRSARGKQDPKNRDGAIKAHCLWCSGSRHEVSLCPVTRCPLYGYRNSRNCSYTGTSRASKGAAL